LGYVQARLLNGMASAPKWVDGLLGGEDERQDLLKQVGADGAALVLDDECHLVGQTPPRHEVEDLVLWLGEKEIADVFATTNLPEIYPAAASYA
ncbi:hypothetical protein SB758_34065, partial [Burkholderia sp. SIMBA_013]